MKTAAAYIRVSTEDQVEYSPDSQIEAIQKYAKAHGYFLPDEYIFSDEGISGKTVRRRTGFLSMIGTAKTIPKPFDVILLWKFSRFARNRQDSIVYKSMLRRDLGIDVISISEDLGNDKMAILFEAMIEAMDEYYSINLAEEVRRGMTEKARRGEPVSVPPFGYKMENKKLIIIPEEAEIIRYVFARYLSGDGFLTIAKSLNELGVRTHRGGLIENRTVEYWLMNPVYAGKIRWNPAEKTARYDYDNKNILVEDGIHEPIIGEEEFRRAKEKVLMQKELWHKWCPARDTLSHWLVGIVKCGICGAPVSNIKGYIGCSRKHKGTCTGNGSVNVKSVGDAVIRELCAMSEGIDAEVMICGNERTDTDRSSLISIQLEKAGLRLKRVLEAYESGVDTLSEYKEKKERIAAEIEALNTEMSLLPEYVNTVRTEKQDKIRNVLSMLESSDYSEAEKNKIAKQFIDRIIKTGSDGRTFKIYFR